MSVTAEPSQDTGPSRDGDNGRERPGRRAGHVVPVAVGRARVRAMGNEEGLQPIVGGQVGVGEWNSRRERGEGPPDLMRAVLCGADLRGAHVSGVCLREAKLAGADLRDALLQGASLAEADLTGADLHNADFQYADLRLACLDQRRSDAAEPGLAGACGTSGVDEPHAGTGRPDAVEDGRQTGERRA